MLSTMPVPQPHARVRSNHFLHRETAATIPTFGEPKLLHARVQTRTDQTNGTIEEKPRLPFSGSHERTVNRDLQSVLLIQSLKLA